MKRALVLIAAALTACGGSQKIDATSARNALPTAASVQIDTPAQSGQALTAAGQELLVAKPSDAYQLTRNVAGMVNLGVGLWIGLVEFVVVLPPTSCAVDTCTWGPWAETDPLKVPATYQLSVTKEADAHYTYKFSAAPGASSTFVDIVAGDVTTNGVPHQGSGSFTVDFDAARTINAANTDTGKLVVTHTNVGELKITEDLTGGTDQSGDHKGQTVNAKYAFDRTGTGGDLQVALHYPVVGNNAVDTRFTFHSRWNTTGAGRTDYTYAAPTSNELSECWGPRTDALPFDLEFQSLNGSVVTGVETDCAFSPAALSTLTVQ